MVKVKVFSVFKDYINCLLRLFIGVKNVYLIQ